MFSALRSLFSHYVHTVLQISLAISSYTETAVKSCLLLIFSCIECATDRSPGPSTMHSLFVSAFMNPASLHAGKQVSTGVMPSLPSAFSAALTSGEFSSVQKGMCGMVSPLNTSRISASNFGSSSCNSSQIA